MVEAVVSFAVEKLGETLIEIAARRLRIKDDVEWLRNELLYMQSCLKDAEEKQSKDHLVKQWLSDIRNLAKDIVDVLDDFNINAGSAGEVSKPGFVDRVKKCACFCEKEANLHSIGNEIESLRKRVLDLSRKRETYGITSISDAREAGPSDTIELRRTTSYLEEEQFVGFEDVTNMLLAELLKEEDRRCVISIYGMGGLGKTTLARKLYNSADIQGSFTRRAWVCVSQEYSVEDLLRTIIKSFKRQCCKDELEMLEKMNRVDLERYLREFLKEDRYLVVVDDVWHKEAWESLRKAFPDRRNGSRVIITTRKQEVAERVDDLNFVHRLRFLRPDESWDLFKKKIFRRDGHGQWFAPAMQKMGKEMVEKCGGLPLAVVVLGGLLSNKKQVEEWHKVKEQLWQHIKNDTIEVTHLLSSSYNDLSDALKKCFLYVGIFPEDYVISAEKLMLLWIAEGFIPQSNRMEDIAEDYLHELINRNLIQVAHTTWWGRIRWCRIHDLLRDLAIEKAMEVNLFDIYDPRVYSAPPSRRRQAINTQIQKFFSCDLSSAKLRSLVFFNPDSERPDLGNLMLIFEKFKYLCVLDLEHVRFLDLQMLPDAIGNLIHLKFLTLDCTPFKELPPSIGNLKSLQTLLILGSAPCRLPLEISKLINLRHFHIYGKFIGLLQIDTLINLRILRDVKYDQWIDIDTVNLVNIQELYLYNIAPLIGKPYSLDSISNLKSLTTLTLLSHNNTLPPLEPLFSCPNLLRLRLRGHIEKLPPFDEFLQSLTMLSLEGSQLEEDPMPILEKLSNLRRLELRDHAYIGNEINCSNNGFQQLEYLTLYHLPNLENWRLAETAMPVIRSLSINRCPKLETVPKKLKYILAEPEITCSNNRFQQLEYLSLSWLPNLKNWRLAETTMPVIRSLWIKGCPKLETIPKRLKSILLRD